MNIVVTSLIFILGLSHCSARGIPDSYSGFKGWPYIPIPAPDEVWRDPVFDRSAFEDFDIDFDAVTADPKVKIEENDASNSNANSEEYDDENLKQNDLNGVAKNLNSDEEERKTNNDEEEDKNDHSEDEENVKMNEEEEDYVAKDDDDAPNEGKVDHVNNVVPPFFGRGSSLNNPFFNLKKMTNYLKELERAFEQAFRQTMEEAALFNGTYANTTEKKVDIDGQKFLVQKSVIKTGDNNSSIYIESVDVLPEPETNRTKRSNWYAEKAQKAEESDP